MSNLTSTAPDPFETSLTLCAGIAASRDLARYEKLPRKLHLLADQLCESAQRLRAPACKPGCDACCHGLILATLPELFRLYNLVASWSESDRVTFMDRLRANRQRSDAYWNYEAELLDAACPFLIEGLCSAYEDRPCSCRGRSSFDPAKCVELVQGKKVELEDVPGQYEGCWSIANGASEAFRRQGLVGGLYDLSFALDLLLSNPEIAPRMFFEKTAIDRARSGLEQVDHSRWLSREAIRIRSVPGVDECAVRLRSDEVEEVWAKLPSLRGVDSFVALSRAYMPMVYESEDHRLESIAHVDAAIQDIENGRFDPKEMFESLVHYQPFLLAYAGVNVKDWMTRMQGVIQRSLLAYRPDLAEPLPEKRRPGKFRLGYISHRLRNFNGSRWALGWLCHHSEDVETYAFNFGSNEDEVTLRWRRLSDHFFNLMVPATAAAEFIRSLDLDAMIFPDIGMDGVTLQLSALRLARTQLTAWGHPVTSGSPQLEGYLSSDLMEPANGQVHYSERLVRLPGSGLTYPRIRIWPSTKSHAELGVPKSGFYLCAQNVAKLLPRSDPLYARISRASGLPIYVTNLGPAKAARTLERRLRAAGVDAHVFENQLSREDFLRLNQLATSLLDVPDWNGGNTIVQAMSLGRMTVSRAGEFMRGRHTLAFAQIAGVPECVATSDEEFVSLALDLDRQREIETRIQIDPLFDDVRPVRAIEELLLSGTEV